jgi:DNA-nicking Smr family endonuclease
MSDVVRIQGDGLADVGRADPNRRRHFHAKPDAELADQQAAATPALRLPANADEADPADLFRYAVQGTQAIEQTDRMEGPGTPPPPHPIKRSEDERAALRESMEAPLSFEDRLEMGDEAVFLRPGLPRRVLIDLRRGRWVLQAQVDLHGFNRDEARAILAQFLTTSLQQGRRCVRVIHGKGLGSPGKESILKQLSRGWLAQREEILAFCQAGPHEGGSGALLVLLRAQNVARP